jgi:hypothetical protein
LLIIVPIGILTMVRNTARRFTTSQIEKRHGYTSRVLLPPVFVVGYMHSGTTLLINILRNNSTVFSGNRETKYFMHLPLIKRTFPDLSDDQVLRNFVFYVIAVVKIGYSRANLEPEGNSAFNLAWFGGEQKYFDVLLSEAKRYRNHETMFALVSDHMTRAMSKRRWVEKTPTHIFHIDEIAKTIPDALFVEIKRDVRDVLASKKTRRMEVWNSEKYVRNRSRKNLEKAFDPFWDALSWQTAVRAGDAARKKYPKHFYSVRYEDLVTNPEAETRKICEFLKMGFEREMLDIKTQNGAVSDHAGTKTTGIVTTSVGRWKSVLSPSEIAVIQWRTASQLEKANYEIKRSSILDTSKIPFVLMKSSFEFFERLYHRWHLGGWLYLQNIFSNYLKRIRLLIQTKQS